MLSVPPEVRNTVNLLYKADLRVQGDDLFKVVCVDSDLQELNKRPRGEVPSKLTRGTISRVNRVESRASYQRQLIQQRDIIAR